jgi:hypothetical protein
VPPASQTPIGADARESTDERGTPREPLQRGTRISPARQDSPVIAAQGQWHMTCTVLSLDGVGRNNRKETKDTGALTRLMHEPPAATADMADLPGVFGSRILPRTEK